MPISAERLKEVELIKDEDINLSDISELDGEFFEHAAMVIRIPNGIKIVIAPQTWQALANSPEGLEYHVKQIKLALKNYSEKQIT
ncbi:MAG: hypothetical protein HUU32_10620 [Calditrichaceae bacterium]|nr:hypothetical protein [Calditrichia bacterium]NUQ41837.1 hypothetical protein [Calditrichaceae bacterium]